MGEWRPCWPGHEHPQTRVRAEIRIPISPGVFSYRIAAEDTAEAWMEFMHPDTPASDHFDTTCYDHFAPSIMSTLGIPPIGGSWSSPGSDDFTVSR